MIPRGWVLPSVPGSGAQSSLLRAGPDKHFERELRPSPAPLPFSGPGGVSIAAAEAQGRRLRQTDRLG
jgi:hypothetical protein